ncbi:carbohydrate kinase family protein [Streptacidiphilus sp. PB12-B1b]|uniref:PfkB family carbohydrate kinase n=1 Tax=Streptacidiphilus sp. PB12-B1b TaxID=2705012 RepID=UPI0015F78BA2|nr:PfkB family carbohydrate kinase [Streptacidiphilus sp. PB12-B1b]QMU74746.1 carbohydrate kinase family protein [Streptacidiphilus sp. PB12-B1b]
MERLDVIGNISLDVTHYPDHRGGSRLGGAAVLLAVAVVSAGGRAAPVCVLGDDLAHLPLAPEFEGVDWSASVQGDGASTTFDLQYDLEGDLVAVRSNYGVADGLTAHALRHIGRHPRDTYHVCCRRPLDVEAILRQLVQRRCAFSVDFFLPSAEAMIRAAAAWLPMAKTLFVNAAEYRLLEQVVDTSTLREVIVTDGPRAAVVRHLGQQSASAVPPPHPPREVAGAGDTLAGTFLALRAQGATTALALAEATAAASRHVAAPPLPIPAPRRA